MKLAHDGGSEDEDDPRLAREALALWRQGRTPVPPDRDDLAAWLEGRAPEEPSAAIERALAADPVLLRTVLAIRSQSVERAPRREIRRARALVAGRSLRGNDLGAARLGYGMIRRPAWALTSLLVVSAAAAGGFALGAHTADLVAQQRTAALRGILVVDTTAWSGED